MNNLKLHEAKRLHYGKYLYKLKIQNQLATIFRTDLQRNGNLLYAEQKLKELVQRNKSDEAIIVKSYYKTTIINPTDLDTAYQIYKCLKNSNEYMVRCETNTLIVYTSISCMTTRLQSA
jgi:hypothetical protein